MSEYLFNASHHDQIQLIRDSDIWLLEIRITDKNYRLQVCDQIHVYSILCNDLVIIVFTSLNIDFISYNGLYYPNPYIYIYKGLCSSACPSVTLLWTNPGTNIYHKCVGSGNISQSQVGVGKQFLHTRVCGCIYVCPIYRHFLSCSSQLKSH